MTKKDIIDQLVGTSLLLRQRRPLSIEYIQKSYDSLFNVETQSFLQTERFAMASFVAMLHDHKSAIQHYTALLTHIAPDLLEPISSAGHRAKTHGPYGNYPDGPLKVENVDGLHWSLEKDLHDILGAKLSSGLEHAHRLIFHPRDSKKEHLVHLSDTNWDDNSIVTLSQLIAFLSFQLRLATGLSVLKESQNANLSS
ncbi:CMD domain protein [Bartonella tamiae]|uniref:Avi_7170 family CMD domain-containing protein n=1 Tax=Bartonella tamiae Th239 TaxID=1094558 RepID=J0R4L9_9HYPH|nr:CMD domain protein [Bartonella tamiae]EJF90609.1 Avi_7170 family CMD domain-containing protein [Bartonella tamiae Th239]EJF94013.1 Avi_7170 family CMD domain-containing protein [Bartonella tamiae Th307]